MMEFKQLTINSEELYKQFKNAVDKGHTYLRIKQPASNSPLYFNIDKDDDNDEIFVQCAGDRTYNFFNNKIDNFLERSYCVLSLEKRVFIPLPKANGRKTSKKTTNKYTFDFGVEKNTDFIDELNKSNNDIKFQTEEEYKIETLENTLNFLQSRLKDLDIRVGDAEYNIKQLDEKKSNKFFI